MLILPKQRKIFVEQLSFNSAVPLQEQADLMHCGISMGMPKVTSQADYETMCMGLFGGSGDPNKFYPNLGMSDIMPKAEDFLDVPMRFLTATIVGGSSWKASDFSKDGVLKASVEKLANKPMFTEHTQEVDNWVGLVINPFWEGAFKQDEMIVPAGISGTARVAIKVSPKLAYGIMFGAIYSSSVTVDFAWEMSHVFEDAREFYDKVGQLGKDGKMVRRVAVDIRDFHESSFVWLGADPFAKTKRENGNLNNIDKGSVYFSKPDLISYNKVGTETKEKYEAEKKFSVECGIDESIISLSQKNIKKPVQQEQTKQVFMKKKFLLALIASFGKHVTLTFKADDVTGDELSEAQAEEAITAFTKLTVGDKADTAKIALADKVTGMALAIAKKADDKVTDVDMEQFLGANTFVSASKYAELEVAGQAITELATSLKVDAKDVKMTVTSMIPKVKDGEAYVKHQRDEATRLYKLAKGEKADDKIVEMIQEAEGDKLSALLKDYGGTAASMTAAFCTSCKSSENIEMRSSLASEDDNDEDDDKGGDREQLSAADFSDQLNDDNNNFVVGAGKKNISI